MTNQDFWIVLIRDAVPFIGMVAGGLSVLPWDGNIALRALLAL